MAHGNGKRGRRERLLYRLEAGLEAPMFLLAVAWLWLFALELLAGLSPLQERAVLAIWGLFIAEYLLKLHLAPRKRAYIRRNWITAIALVLPAFRAIRLLRALYLLRSIRVASTARMVRALTSTRRFFSALQAAQGPAPEPEMDVAVLVAASPGASHSSLHEFTMRVTSDVRAEMEAATRIRWTFHPVDPVALESDSPRPPSDYLDEASMRMAEGPYDLALVVTDVGLVSRQRHVVPGLASPTTGILVLSTRKLVATPRGQPPHPLDSAPVRWNAGALLLHLLGHIGGLKHTGKRDSEVMAPFAFRPRRSRLPGFNAREKAALARAGTRLPERKLHGGDPVAALVFHVLMALRHPRAVVAPLLRNRAFLLPLSLPGLATAAVAPTFLLVFTAEIWDVGLNMSGGTAGFYAGLSIVGASFYLARVQSLFLPRKEKRVLTEHLAVANCVIFLSILLACIGLFAMVGALMMLIEVYIFPADLMQTWPTLDQPGTIGLGDKLRLAIFISTIGVTTGALAGGLDKRAVIQHLALFQEERWGR